jgi:hypothetical protein
MKSVFYNTFVSIYKYYFDTSIQTYYPSVTFEMDPDHEYDDYESPDMCKSTYNINNIPRSECDVLIESAETDDDV